MHRAEVIMAAVKTTLSGLTATAGINVYRGRAYAVDQLKLPALLVFMGEDDKELSVGPDRIASTLAFKVEAVALDKADAIETTLNTMRREVAVALGADGSGQPQLNLPNIVIQIEEIGTEEPDIQAADQVFGRQVFVYTVQYDRSRADPAN